MMTTWHERIERAAQRSWYSLWLAPQGFNAHDRALAANLDRCLVGETLIRMQAPGEWHTTDSVLRRASRDAQSFVDNDCVAEARALLDTIESRIAEKKASPAYAAYLYRQDAIRALIAQTDTVSLWCNNVASTPGGA
jgi:hypothetical protein